ncbi:hypothetical protein COBT_002728, partial [Conglomerata obtusa]
MGSTELNLATQPQSDMASAVNAVKDFGGGENDDVFTWERQILTTFRVFQLNEISQMKLLLCKLKGKAGDWLANVLTESPYYGAEDILKLIKKQFSNTNANHRKLNKFLAFACANCKDDFAELLDLADDIFQRRAVNEDSLIKLTIARCPPIMRPVLIKFTYNDGEWYSFLKEAKQNAWIAFTEEVNFLKEKLNTSEELFEIRKKNKFVKKSREENQNCLIHGRCAHSTRECKTLDEMKKRGIKVWKDKKNVNVINETQEEESSENLNKKPVLYFLKNYVSNKNIFLMYLQDINNKHDALIDTGSDINLI